MRNIFFQVIIREKKTTSSSNSLSPTMKEMEYKTNNLLSEMRQAF